jgi:hypothetical protein
MDGPRCAQGGMLVLYLFGISKNPRHFSPSPQRRCLVHHLHSGPTPSNGLHHLHVM